MPSVPLDSSWEGVRRLLAGQPGAASASDTDLLGRFRESGDEAAFAAIVARHGPMVARVAWSVLPCPTEVDDAYQATFLILARRPEAIRDGDRLGSWLHGVARRVALRARAQARRRANRAGGTPADLAALPDRAGAIDPERVELGQLVVAELGRLPRLEALAVTVCDLDGLSHREAADHLGWPLGTVKTRVARGRHRLRARLTQRGWNLDLPTLGATLAHAGAETAALARPLTSSTARAAGLLAAGHPLPPGLVAPGAWALSRRIGLGVLVAPGRLVVAGLGMILAVGAVPSDQAGTGGAAAPIPTLAAAPVPAAAAAPTPAAFGSLAQPGRTEVRFERAVIDPAALLEARRVEVVDMDGDKRLDLLVVGTGAVAWYQNPTWTRHVVTATGQPVAQAISDATAADLDRDGRAEVALAVDSPEDDLTRGQVLLARPGPKADDPWTVAKLRDLPMVRQVRFGDLDGDGRPDLAATVRGLLSEDRRRKVDTSPGILVSKFDPADLRSVVTVTQRSDGYGRVSALEIVPTRTFGPERFAAVATDWGVWSLSFHVRHPIYPSRKFPPLLAMLAHTGRWDAKADPRGCRSFRVARSNPSGVFVVGVGPDPRAPLTVWDLQGWSELPPRVENDPEGAARRVNALVDRVRTILGPHPPLQPTPLDGRPDGRCVATLDLDGAGSHEIIAGYGGAKPGLVRYRREGPAWVGTEINGADSPIDLREGDLDGDGVPDLVALITEAPGLVWYRTVRPSPVQPPR